MSDLARVASGQSGKTTGLGHQKKTVVETHAPYDAAEAEAGGGPHVGRPPPSSTVSAASSSAWRLPETITVAPFSEPAAAEEPTMAAVQHRPYDTAAVSTGGGGGGVSRGRPTPPAGTRASAEAPTMGSVGGPGRHTDPASAAMTRPDPAPSTSKAGASSSGASATALPTNDVSAQSTSSSLVTSGGPAAATTTTNNNNSGGSRANHSSNSSGGCAAAATVSSPSAPVPSAFAPSNGPGPGRDATVKGPPLSATAAVSAGPSGLSTGPARASFNNVVVPPPLQTLSSSPAAAATAAAGAGASLPPMPPPPPPHATSTTAASHVEHNNHNTSGNSGGGGGGTATEAKEKAADPYTRPAVALSAHLLDLYKMVNAQYCAQRRLESPGPKYNNGYDDKDGHYLFLPGEVIFQRYIAQEVLGKGSFGTVIRGFDQKRSEAVAMKITRRGSSFRSQAKLELDILLRLNENPALNHLVVRLLKVFEWQGHLVLVFELLSFNLYQLIKCTRFNGVSLDLVRKFAYQLTHTLLQLESQKPHPIIHCDIKPENILLRNQNRSGIRLIDFGSACYTAKRFHRYIQSRFYRSPEVILFLEYGTAIDRWSLACVLVELHTGVPLFDGRTEAAQLAKFESTLGPMPPEMIAGSPKASRFYYGSLAAGFQLKEPVPERRSLESVIGVTTGGPRGRRLDTPGHDEKSYREFYDFIARFLHYQPEERMSCRDALQHPFLMPLYTSDLMQQQERVAQHRQQTTPPQQQQQGQQGLSAAPSATQATGTSSSTTSSAAKSGASAAPTLRAEEKSGGDTGGAAARAHA